MFSRTRQWTDLLPWVRLFRTARAAASPPLLLITSVFLAVWLVGQYWLLGRLHHSWSTAGEVSIKEFGSTTSDWAGSIFTVLPTGVFAGIYEPSWHIFLASIWSLVVWTPLALFMARQGGLLTAGRTMEDAVPLMKTSLLRSPRGWITALVPLVCACTLGLAIVLAGWVSLVGIPVVEFVCALLASPVALVIGILVFFATTAVPLSWASLAMEREADPLDSLSRGYEYTFRRLVNLVFYVSVGLLLMLLASVVATWVARFGFTFCAMALQASGSSVRVTKFMQALMFQFPTVVVITLFWNLVGGTYLLLRRDAGGQEVEDVWIQSRSLTEPPTVPT